MDIIRKEINTCNIDLHPAAEKYAQDIFDIIITHKKYLAMFLDWVNNINNINEILSFLSKSKSDFGKKSNIYIIEFKNKIVGVISLNSIDKHKREADIGYWISPDYEGLGIISKSLQTMIDKHSHEIKKFILKCAVFNTRSNMVALRNGFSYDCIIHKGEIINGVYHDQNQYYKCSSLK
ncbi:GNAT family N-acetyltransferase [Conservatibacter flavescens]|nr:GNAT family N-acetyltransferase [Conservatibacter flavescens]